jgi:FAD/FMN-containing dehydrogenase
MLTRRRALRKTAAISAGVYSGSLFADDAAREGIDVNDEQSQFNLTRVRRIEQPQSLDELQAVLSRAARRNEPISLSGGRHSMGGQQFAADGVLLDATGLNKVVHFDRERGLIEVEGGIQWPELIEYLVGEQQGQSKAWCIREKQSGVDKVTIAGSLASNIHGRGLKFPPIIGDVESFVLVDAQGDVKTCSRRENAELFSLAIGGYGLFGVIARITLRLVPRKKVERVVEIIPVGELISQVESRIADGFVFGDCQYSTNLNETLDDHPGVFACYRPVDDDRPIAPNQKELSAQDWASLYRLARTNKPKAFETYSKYYLSTTGQVYWWDQHQLSGKFQSYREALDADGGTEVLTEAYVPHDNFVPFMQSVRQDFIDHNSDMTYGTIRFIEKDNESFLAWARERLVCIVCNLHVLHTDEGKRKAAEDFRRIIDRTIEFGGRYYLTYHRHATRKQVEACYPKFVEFLRLKKKYDPQERLQSDWYRHYRSMFADAL